MSGPAPSSTRPRVGTGAAPGKVILFGEHAVVYDRPAVAATIRRGLGATAEPDSSGPVLRIPTWGREGLVVRLHANGREFDAMARAFALALEATGNAPDAPLSVTVEGELPLGVGLGSSAAFAVALLRALADFAGEKLSPEALLQGAADLEGVFHGTPSGLDHTVIARGGCLRFRRSAIARFVPIRLAGSVPVVIGWTAREGSTREAVAELRRRRDAHPWLYERLFDAMAEVAEAGVDALEAGDLPTLGTLFDLNHGYLSAAGVCHPANARMVHLARTHGALGAKITGAGCGGAVIAVAPTPEPVLEALRGAGYDAFATSIG